MRRCWPRPIPHGDLEAARRFLTRQVLELGQSRDEPLPHRVQLRPVTGLNLYGQRVEVAELEELDRRMCKHAVKTIIPLPFTFNGSEPVLVCQERHAL